MAKIKIFLFNENKQRQGKLLCISLKAVSLISLQLQLLVF